IGIPRSSTNWTSKPCFSKKPFFAPTQSGLYPRVLLDAPRKILGFSCAIAEGGAKAQTRSANTMRKRQTMEPPCRPFRFYCKKESHPTFPIPACWIKTKVESLRTHDRSSADRYWDAIA